MDPDAELLSDFVKILYRLLPNSNYNSQDLIAVIANLLPIIEEKTTTFDIELLHIRTIMF